MKPRERRRWVNVGLVVAASLSVMSVVATQESWTSGERSVRAEHLVVGFRTEQVRRVEVRSGEEMVVIERGNETVETDAPGDDDLLQAEDSRWTLVEPYQGEAEEAAVDSLLRAIEHAPVLRQVDEQGFDRGAAGLDAPASVVSLEMGDVRTRIRVGATAPAPANSRYVEVGGEGTANKGVYVVSETTAKELQVRPDAFRVKQVVPYGEASLARLTLSETNGARVTLTKEDQTWRLQASGRKLRLDAAAIQRLFAAFARSRAEVFPPQGTESAPPAAASTVDVTFVPKAPTREPLTVRFGGPCPTGAHLQLAVTLREPPLRACTTPLHLDSFVRSLPDMVDRHLFASTEPDAVEEIRIQSDDKSLELARRGEGWTMRKPREGEVERAVGDAFVSDVLRIQGELVEKPTRQLSALGSVSVMHPRSTEDPAEETVEVFTDGTTEPSLWVHRLQDDAWLTITAKHRRLFAPSALLLAPTKLLSLELERLGAVTMRTPQWSQRFVYEGRQTGCKLLAPSGYAADSALCLDVLDELRVLQARRWVAEQDDGGFGLAQPTLRLEFESRFDEGQGQSVAGTSERVLTIGARSADGDYYAQLSPNPAVFTLKERAVEALSTLVIDRSPFIIDGDRVEALTVRRGGEGPTMSLRRLGEELIEVPTSGEPAPRGGERRAVELLDALTSLRPEAAIELLPVGSPAAAPPRFGFTHPALDVTLTVDTDGQRAVHRWVVGVSDVYRDASVYYAMNVTSGPSAVFALPREAVQRILAAL